MTNSFATDPLGHSSSRGVRPPPSIDTTPHDALAEHRVPEQPACGGAGLLVVVDRDFAVDQHPAVADAALDPPPLTGREVVHLLDRRHAEPVEVVDDDVGGFPDFERAAVGEARA